MNAASSAALARAIVDRQMDAIEAHLTRAWDGVLSLEFDTDYYDQFEDMVGVVRREQTAECRERESEPGPNFDQEVYAQAGFLVGLELGRRLGRGR